MIRGFKIRIYPTKEQEQSLWQHIGASRWIYNFMLDEQKRRYENGEKHMSAFDMNKYITVVKKQSEHEWLKEVSTNTLQRVCADLAKAYDGFFAKRAKFPKYKSRKRSKKSFPLCDAVGRVWFKERTVHVPIVGNVKYKTDLSLPYGRDVKLTNPRISFVRNKWMLSFGIECENQAPELTDSSMGIDLGVKNLAIAAIDDECIVFHNINKSKRMRYLKRQLRYHQRKLSRKYEANRIGKYYAKSRNITKEEAVIRRIHEEIAGIRTNYIHQVTHALVSKLPKRIVMEDLNVSGMMKNRHLSKAIQEECFHEFQRQMRYKCEWNGIEYVQVGKFYPSSKTCSGCGTVKADLTLKDRAYVCDCCGLIIDRDYNAAVNLMRYVA